MNAPVRFPLRPVSADSDDWIELITRVASHYRLPASVQKARLESLWSVDDDKDERIRAIARACGLSARFAPPARVRLSRARMPMLAEMRSGEALLITGVNDEGDPIGAVAGEIEMAITQLAGNFDAEVARYVLLRPVRAARDSRVDAYIRPYREHWLRRILFADLGAYSHVLVASLVANCLALAGILFSMQVYDRVIPAGSMPTLYVLFLGVLLAIGFDFLLRRLRVNIIDVLGKRADLRISDTVFGHALRVRNRERPKSTGTFIAQLRDIDQVRELLTSTTVAAIADLPFFLLFLGILWLIGGALALVPLAALLALVVPGLLLQRRMRQLASESMRESSLRNALLVETVQGIEDVKALQAETRFQRQWNHYNAVAGNAQLKQRAITNGLNAWTQNVQTGVYATLVFVGAPMVIAGDMTTGALVAASMLGSRMMAPMAQVTSLLTRFQHARLAAQGLDQVMALPVDSPDAENRIALSSVRGSYTLRSASFGYGDTDAPPALNVPRLDIAAGEKIAVLGRNGAGKSTLLQALSGMMQPLSGEILLDDVALDQIDPVDVRREVGLLTQSSRLFHGTIRENLTLGAPGATDEELLWALSLAGADGFVRQRRAGMEYMVLEGGRGLSGGQIQSLMLARLLLRQPAIALLDEPTAAMDEGAERHFLAGFAHWSRNRTIVIATHRMRALDLVDRVIVVDGGTIVLDKPKAEALRAMRGTTVKPT